MVKQALALALFTGASLVGCGTTDMPVGSTDSAQSFSCDTVNGAVHTCVDYLWVGSTASLDTMKKACTGTVGTTCSQTNASGGCRVTAMTSGLSVQTTTWTYGGWDKDTQAACVKATGNFVPNPSYVYDPGPYPAGPYGVDRDSILADVSGNGYALTPQNTDATTLTIGKVSIDVIRANPACKCLMLSQSATWCGPCNAEQQELVDAVTADPTFCVFNVLVDGPKPGTRATNDDVTNWNLSHAQNFPIVGASVQTYLHLPTPTALPTNVVIDPHTMKILSINMGIGPTTISDAKALCAGM